MDRLFNAAQFGKRLKKYRQKKHLSQMQLSELIGSSPASISHLENGTHSPSLETLIKLSTAFGVGIDELLADSLPSKRRNTVLDLTTISSTKLRQEIKDFLKLIFTGKATFTHTSRYMPELFFFLAYIEQLKISSIFDISNDDMRDGYLKYRNVIEEDNPKRFVNALYFHLTQAYDTRKGFERDIWTLDDFKLEEIRLNPTARIHNISFIFIKNEENKELLKKYIKYLVGGSY